MSDQNSGFFSRIGGWFKREQPPTLSANETTHGATNGTLNGDSHASVNRTTSTLGTELAQLEPRPSILRPFAKRDQALSNLQEGFNTLTDLMAGIKDNMTEHGRRQDELLGYLSHLPKAIEGIPETNRLQVESLKAISARLDQQNQQQNLIAEVLGKLADNDANQKEAVDDIRQRVHTVTEQNVKIADNLSNVGSAMENLGKNSQASTQVLQNLRDTFQRRDGQLERILQKQASRFTAMLSVAIILSVAALVAVVILLLKQQPTANPTSAPANNPTSVVSAG